MNLIWPAMVLVMLGGSASAEQVPLLRRFYNLQDQTTAQLRLMRNEVFAAHGRVFSNTDLQAHFSKQEWYKPNPGYSEKLLSSTDRAIIKIISEAEAARRAGKNLEIERDPEKFSDYFGDVIIDFAAAQISSGTGIPGKVDRYELGKKAEPCESKWVEFIGLNWFLEPDCREGVVRGMKLHQTYGSVPLESKEKKIEALLNRFVGSVSKYERGYSVWRKGNRTLRFRVQGIGGGGSAPFITIDEAPADAPGNPMDGIVPFLDKLSHFVGKPSAEEASALFKFPLDDYSAGPEGKGSLSCGDKNELMRKLETIVQETGIGNHLSEDDLSFHWPDHYTLSKDGRDFAIVQVDGTWKVGYFPYHE